MKTMIFAIAGLLLASIAPLHADNAADAKKIYQDKQDSVIWITGVAKISFTATGKAAEGMADLPDKQIKVMALGTIVSPDGYVVAMLSQLDPSAQVKDRTVRTKKGTVKINATFVGMSELKAVMPDGTEIPSELLMKDENLDLAIVRVKTTSKEAAGMVYHAVDLNNSAEGHILDEVVTVSRMPEDFSCVPSVARGHITMITKRPRVFLRADGATAGCPTFTMDGKLVGITSARKHAGRIVETAIIPAVDILEVVEQSKKIGPGTEVQGKAEAKPAKPVMPEKNGQI
jgi:S1-C subfamily serine protease